MTPPLPTSSQRPVYELRIYVSTDNDELLAKYHAQFESRQSEVAKYVAGDDSAVDAGIDLYCPASIMYNGRTKIHIPQNVHCSMWFNGIRSSYYMYPRSSCSKTPLRLANSLGVIDSGYVGDITAVFDVIRSDDSICGEAIPQYTRLVQLCSPNITYPIRPVIVDSIEELGGASIRGSDGFGSTGR